jgi:hypothetical protein
VEEFSHDIRDVHEENKDREQVQSEEQNETIEIEKEERQSCLLWLPLMAYIYIVSSYCNCFKHWGC